MLNGVKSRACLGAECGVRNVLELKTETPAGEEGVVSKVSDSGVEGVR